MMLSIESFEIAEKIYESSHSKVFRGIRKADNLSVVIKLLSDPMPSKADLARFKREFDTLKKLAHDGIIKALSFERIQSNYAIIFEDIGAYSLRAHFGHTPVTIPQFLDFGLQLTQIVGYLHGQSIIHKDINPCNIIWDPDTNRLQLIDFSICSELQRENIQDAAGLAEGTIAYMAPEQTGRMNRSVDFRSDFYSLGVTFYELLTGHIPFQDDDISECIHSHIAKAPPDPRLFNRAIPDGIVGMLEKLMAKDAEARYQSALGLMHDLEYCQQQWNRSGQIPAFPLAREDVRSHFAVPEKLYGRDEEIKEILEIFVESMRTGSQFLTVSGFSGIGKSALIHEIRKPIAGKKGFFISGKFDQFSRNLPFSALIQALQSLAAQLSNLPSAHLQRFADTLKQVLGPNASIINELVPEFVDIIGPLPSLPPLDPEQARNRSMLTIMAFIKVVCSESHPLAIFLDDMQWSDQGTMNVLEYLLTGAAVKGLLIIAAFRHNELSAGHPFQITLDLIRKVRPFHEFQLRPLTEPTVRQLIADTLQASVQEVEPLVAIVYRKTAGNPFFTSEFLTELRVRNLIRFDSLAGRWTWDLKGVASIEVPDNVVDMLIDKLKLLTGPAQKTLQIASCIGNQFTWQNLSLIQSADLNQLAAGLWEALQREVIVPLDDHYRLLQTQGHGPGVAHLHDFNAAFKFRHDRLQEACSEQMEPVEKRRTHLFIARFRHAALEKSADKDASFGKQVIDIVRHYNEALDLVSERDEQLLVAHLNLKGAQRARHAVAYKPAYEMVKAGLTFLGEKDWDEHYELLFDLYNEYVQCAYLLGLYDEAEQTSHWLLDHARTRLEKVQILLMQAIQCNANSKKEESVRKGLQGLALLGLKIPEKPGLVRIFIEIAKSKFLLGRRTVASLEEAPRATDTEKNLMMRFFNVLTPASFQTGASELFALSILKSVNITLRYGSFPESPYTYVAYGMLLTHILGQHAQGLLFADLGLRLLDRYNPVESNKGSVLSTYSVLFSHWYHRPSEVIQYFNSAIGACHEAGDVFWMGVDSCLLVPSKFDSDDNLEILIAECKKAIEVTEQTKMPDIVRFSHLVHGYFSCLKGLTCDPQSLSLGQHDEATLYRDMRSTKFYTGVQTYHTLKSVVAFLNRDIEAAEKHSRKAIRLLETVMGLAPARLAHVFRFFILAAQAHQITGWRKPLKIFSLYRHYFFIQRWAQTAPANFQHLASLMKAELSRIRRKSFTATLALYDKAIAAAQNVNDFNAALACELAGEFCFQNNLFEAARAYMTKSALAFERFGAHPKALHLVKTYGLSTQTVLLSSSKREAARSSHSSLHKTDSLNLTASGTASLLDHLTALKTAQSLASEIKIENLFRKIMEALVQNAGAEQGFLIMQNSKNQSWEIRVACRHGQGVEFLVLPIESSNRVPVRIIQTVIDRNEVIVLEDAAQRGAFTDLTYIQEHKIRSVLTVPFAHKGRIIGVAHLENNLAAAVFTEARAELVRLLSSHAAVALENSQLYAELEDKVAENTRDIQTMLKHLRQGILSIVEGGRIHSKFSDYLAQIMQTDDIAGCEVTSFIFSFSSLSSDQIAQIKNVLHSVGEHRLSYEMNEHCLISEFTRIMPDGSSKILNLDWAPIFSEHDTIEKILVTIRDATDIRTMQVQAKRQEEELQAIGELLQLTSRKWRDFYENAQNSLHAIESILLATHDFDQDQINHLFVRYHTLKGHARALQLSRLLPLLHESEETLAYLSTKRSWERDWLLADVKRCCEALEYYQNVFVSKLHSHSQVTGWESQSWEAVKDVISRYCPGEKHRLEFYSAVAMARTLDSIVAPILASLPDLARELHKIPPLLKVEGDLLLFHEEGAQLLANILMHLVRNSLDHGLEIPAIRSERSKPLAGQMELMVKRLPQRIEFEWRDDGAGMDLDAIRGKAMEVGIIKAADQLRLPELAELIFHAGLSTKDKATSISGRGVGMHAVRQLLRDHGGDVEIVLPGAVPLSGHQSFVVRFYIPSALAFRLSESTITAA